MTDQAAAGTVPETTLTYAPLVKYDVSAAAIEKLRKQYAGLQIVDAASYREVVKAIADVRDKRVAVEKRRKELKADALEYGRRVDAEAKRLTTLLLPIEEELKTTKQAEDDRRAEEKAAKERAEKERIEKIVAKLFELQSIPQALTGKTSIELQRLLAETRQRQLTEEIFEEYLPKAERLHTEAVESIERAIEAALIAEQEEAKRQAEELRRKQEEERLAKEKAERQAREKAERDAEIARLEALRKQQEENRLALEAEERRLREEALRHKRELEYQQNTIDANRRAVEEEKRKLEQAKREEAERIAREEAERKAADEAKARAEQEAKEAAERAERQRIEQEKAKAEAEARAKELQPDADKLLEFANRLMDTRADALKSDAAYKIYGQARTMIHGIDHYIRTQVKTLTTTYIKIQGG